MEEGKVRMMVIPIVAMLAVTMVVAGYQYEEEQEIDVDEGREELTIEHHEEGEGSPETNFDENFSITAETIVDNQSSLEFELNPTSIMVDSQRQQINLKVLAHGDFEEHEDVEVFKFTASEKEESEGPFNYIQFEIERHEIDGGERWPQNEQRTGATFISPEHFAYDGSYLNSPEFTVQTRMYWVMPHENMGEEFTLELEAVVGGLSEDVTATVLLHIE